MLHFVTSYMNQNKSRKQTLESAQYGLEISFKLRKHFIEKYFFDDVDLLITREKWFLSSDNSGVIVVKCTRLFNHLLISITGAQRPFMTTGKQ